MSAKETFPVFVTQYALTQGVRVANVEVCHNDKFVSESYGSYTSYYHKPHWHLTREEAEARVTEMLSKKVESLRKQLSKIESKTVADCFKKVT